MTVQLQTRPIVVKQHLKTLQQRYQAVHARAKAESHRKTPDESLVQILIRERTRLHEELARYEGLVRTVTRGVAQA